MPIVSTIFSHTPKNCLLFFECLICKVFWLHILLHMEHSYYLVFQFYYFSLLNALLLCLSKVSYFIASLSLPFITAAAVTSGIVKLGGNYLLVFMGVL